MAPSGLPLIDVDRLRVGVYVVLDVGWRNHPFLRSRFLISSEEQLEQIRALGLGKVQWSPERSTAEPLAESPTPAAPASEPAPSQPVSGLPRVEPARLMEPVSLEDWDEISLHWVESEYDDIATRERALREALGGDPGLARELAEELADAVSTAISECERPAVRLLAERQDAASDGHEVAVMALAVLLGRDAGLDEPTLRQLALAALLHDSGKTRLPAAHREDTGELAAAALADYRRHVEYGVELARSMGLDEAVVRCIAEHHECADGSGFPRGLRGDALSEPGKMLAIANRYMNLVCPQRSDAGLTPHQALQQMYGRERERFDTALLARFVRLLGVYPPGSLVELSDRRIALVVASRPGGALTPRVQIIEQPDGGALSAAIDIDADSAVKVSRSIPPEQLDPRLARRSRELARAAFFVEPAPSPEWRSWDDEQRGTEVSY